MVWFRTLFGGIYRFHFMFKIIIIMWSLKIFKPFYQLAGTTHDTVCKCITHRPSNVSYSYMLRELIVKYASENAPGF